MFITTIKSVIFENEHSPILNITIIINWNKNIGAFNVANQYTLTHYFCWKYGNNDAIYEVR